MSQPCNGISEHPYAEATLASAKRTPSTPQTAPSPWTTSIVESTVACTEDKVFVIGGFDAYKQRLVSYTRMWDAGTHTWTRLPDAPVRVAHASAAAVPGEGSIVLFGGWDGEKCSAELWHLHPRRPDEAAAVGDVVPQPGRGGAGGGGSAANSVNARVRSLKGDDEALLQWDRLEVDPQLCARPVGRYGHAVASGVSAAASRWNTDLPQSPAAGSLEPRDEASRSAGAAVVLSDVSTLTAMEPVLYVFGGNDSISQLNDVWRLWLAPSFQQRVALWERLEFAAGVRPCPREDAVLAFDAALQRLWLYGGRTATDVLDDVWYLSLSSASSSSGSTWTPVYPLGGHFFAPSRTGLSQWFMPASAVVERGSLYVLFSNTPTSAKHRVASDRVPLYRFCLTTYQWLFLPLSEEEVASNRSSTSLQTSLRSTPQPSSFCFVASCACSRFLFWLKDVVDDEFSVSPSTPTVVHVELNVPAAKSAKRRADRSR
ncbi:hypothetical protein LSCM1_00655 [Leishmania martiniquensis]|uniref:Uncharacterized protein n=1 Tax=Leishmania martiniquensis TaxID=1580590 RepID=A0A836K8Y2_9TRYP|nr:hypothetical protein LSCM1_00655 [Leishmania martiniquensis]